MTNVKYPLVKLADQILAVVEELEKGQPVDVMWLEQRLDELRQYTQQNGLIAKWFSGVASRTRLRQEEKTFNQFNDTMTAVHRLMSLIDDLELRQLEKEHKREKLTSDIQTTKLDVEAKTTEVRLKQAELELKLLEIQLAKVKVERLNQDE